VIAIQKSFPRITPEEYLNWEERQDLRHEYIDGEVYAMSGGSANHGEIAANFIVLLKNHLRGRGCRVFTADVKVSIANSTNYFYPDVSVTCDERDRSAEKYISHPCLIVEVLSPTTANYDRGEKFRQYKQSDSLQEYILVSAERVEIDMYRRGERDRWEIVNYRTGDIVDLTSIGLSWPIEQLYEGIIFAGSPPA
jgi:Uma2 family endonuclease